MGLFDALQETKAAILSRTGGRAPAVSIILGSGLSSFADSLEDPVSIPYEGLPHFPRPKVAGHPGKLVMGRIRGVEVCALLGRVHLYEGYAPAEAAFPARVLCALGSRSLVATNAAGGIRKGFTAGDLMAIEDHINLSGQSPLLGPNDERLGPRFPDMSFAYSPKLLALLEGAAKVSSVPLARGVYAMMMGPSYETPAEIRALALLGADAVGMSTVPEILVASHMGVPACGISCITNLAAGLSSGPLSHAEVAAAAQRAQGDFRRLLEEFLPLAARIE
jgi:purine-nucleoside phosphorylase